MVASMPNHTRIELYEVENLRQSDDGLWLMQKTLHQTGIQRKFVIFTSLENRPKVILVELYFEKCGRPWRTFGFTFSWTHWFHRRYNGTFHRLFLSKFHICHFKLFEKFHYKKNKLVLDASTTSLLFFLWSFLGPFDHFL